MEEGVFPIGSDPHEGVFRSVSEAEVSLDEMLSLACRQGKQDIVELLLESGANVNHRNKAGNTPLLEACSQGHVSIARLLLDRNADIDAPTETTYDSALTWACTLGNVEIVRLLLDRKANVEHRTKDGCTALMFAALAGHEKVAKLLLDHKAEINVESDSNKDSPLTFACWKGHQKVVELFLERNADIEHRTKEGFSPLMFAALGGHTQVAELLLKHRAEVNNPSGSNNDIPLTSACWKGHHQVVFLLLQHNSDIEHRTKDGCTPLMLAAREGHLSVAQLLLDHGAKVNMPSGSENNIPLTLACWKGHRDVVNLLLKNVSNIEHQNKAGCTPLMLAAREGHQEATRLLLDSGAQINVPSGSNDDTPLTLACWKGHGEVVSLLIERNSNVNHQTKTGCTPLMEATREGHVVVAKLLLEAGADVETPDNYGQSPFFMACWKGHADVAALLLEYDANKDCRTKTGITPLFQACRENHVDVVKLLLDYGCNPSTPFPNSRECPLTLAAEKGYIELTQLLLSRSAHVEARTKKGCSPLYLACREGYKEIAVMLAKHGASTEAPDLRSTTPLLAAYKNGHFEVVEWLLAHVAHLPSDPECNKALLAPMPLDTDLAPQRSKCIELIMKAKKAREQAALKNAQILCDELDAEREKKESRRKAAAKKRDKRKKKKKQEKIDALEVDKGQGEPDREEELTTHPQQPPSPITNEISVLDPPPPDNSHFQKKRNIHLKKTSKQGPDSLVREDATPLPVDDGSDSGEEYHDALPEFLPTEPLDQHNRHHHHYHHHHHHLTSPISPLSPPSAAMIDHHTPSSASSTTTTTHDSKFPHTSHTDMSATRHGGLPNKRSPQPKAEATSSSKPTVTTSNRRNEVGASVERNRNDQVRGNQGASLESFGSSDKKKNPKFNRKAVERDTSSNSLNNQKNRSRDVNWNKSTYPTTSSHLPIATKGVATNVPITTKGASTNIPIATKGASTNIPIATKGASSNIPIATKGTPSIATKGASTNPPIATRGVSTNASIATKGTSTNTSTISLHKADSSSTESRVPPHPIRSKATSKLSIPRGHRSSIENHRHHVGEDSPCSSSLGSSSTSESTYSSSSTKVPTATTTESNWSKIIYPNNTSSKDHGGGDDGDNPTLSSLPNQQQTLETKPLYNDTGGGGGGKEGYSWASSQESDASWNDVDLDNQIMWSRFTDDDKIMRSRKLKAAQQSVPLHSPSTSAYPTPTSSSSSSSITYTSSQSWQEVTRPTRTVQLTVSNSLVGRIIGRKGSKINNIQVSSGAHINVSRNIPKSTERLITIKGTQRSISKAQELIDEALSTPDSTVEVSAPSPDQGGHKVDPLPPTSPSQLYTRSDSPLSSGEVTHSRPMKRYSDVIPPKDATIPEPIIRSSVTNKRTILKDPVARPIASITAVTLASHSETTTTTTTSYTGTWADIITASVPSPTFQTHQSNSPTLEDLSIGNTTSDPPPQDGDDDRVIVSPIQMKVSLSSEEVSATIQDSEKTEGGDDVDMSTEFPPLSVHSRSCSDPQVLSSAGKDDSNDTPAMEGLTQSLTSNISSKMSSISTPSLVITDTPLTLQTTPPNPSGTLVLSPPLGQDQSPSYVVTVPPKSLEEEQREGEKEEEEVVGSADFSTSVGGCVASLAVGTLPPSKEENNVTVIQPTQQDQTSSLHAKFLPPVCQSNSTPDLTTFPGKHGAIGPPARRESLPSKTRKTSRGYNATLENVGENDPLHSLPASFITPPISSSHSSTWPDRRKSTSVIGQHPYISQNGPFSNPPHPQFKAPPHSSASSHIHHTHQSDDSPGSPYTPHGENLSLHDHDFSTPSGVYGPIGSNMPSMGSSNMPSMGSSNMPSMGSSNMPSMGSSNMPSMGSSNMPSMGSSNMPSMGSSNMPSMGSSNMPSMGSSNMPSMGSSNMPSMGSSNMPSMGSSNMPSMGSSNMPSMGSNMPSMGSSIGSNMPSMGSNIGSNVPPSHIGSNMSNIGVGLSRVGSGGGPIYSNETPPMPPLNMKMPSDIWIPPFRPGGPRGHPIPPQMIPQAPPTFGLPPFLPPHPNHHTSFPSAGGPGVHKSDSAHQRAAMGHQQPKPHGDPGVVPNMGMRHSFGDDSNAYRVDNVNGNLVHPHQKRWSVPNYPYHSTQPPYLHHQGQLDVHYPWGAWAKQPQSGLSHKPMGGNLNGQYSGLEQTVHGKGYAQVGGNILSDNGPWSPQWTTPPGRVGFPSPSPVSRHNGPSLKPQLQEESPGKLKMGRSISCVTEPSWRDLDMGVSQSGDSGSGGTDLLQLMKSLDISSEHMQSLKARKLSLQQLHSMSDEEWRNLKLPVGPRVKLMNAISNIHGKSGPSSQSSDYQSSEASPLSADGSALTTS